MSGLSVITSHTQNVFDLNGHLAGHTYNMYIPTGYDGTTPYGLITFINSGNNGSIINSWIPVLEEKNIIMIAGNDIGNSVSVITRIGVALAGSEKLKQILNIDGSRVFASGNSGGARSSASLLFFFPEKFQGMVPNCGSSYLRQVDQDYETHQPNSHYEYGIFQYTPADLAYVKSFDRRYAMMTSFDDFREGDIMNIYHNGMEPDGFKAKILETTGGHCSTTAEHFRDAMNFVEHPHIDIVRDSFVGAPSVGNGFKTSATTLSNQQLVFNHNTSNIARAYSNNPFLWNDDKGAILRTSLEIDSISYNQNTFFNIGLLDYADPNVYNEDLGHELYASKPNLLLNLVFNGPQPTVNVLAESPTASISNDTLFSGTLSDWSAGQALAIKYHIWNQEVRIELSGHFDPNVQVKPNVKLLDDNRSIRFRMSAAYFDSTDFQNGTMLTFVSGKLDSLSSSSLVKLNHVEVVAADSLNLVITSASATSPVLSAEPFWIFPNPSQGQFELESAQIEVRRFDVYDHSGRKVGIHSHDGISSQLDLSHLNSGLYYLHSIGVKKSIPLLIRK